MIADITTPLEGCDTSWREQLPEPTALPESVEAVARWLTVNRVPIDPGQRIGDLLPDAWRSHFFEQRLEKNALPTFRTLSDPAAVRKFFPHKVQQEWLMRDIRGALRPYAFMPAFRAAFDSVKKALENDSGHNGFGPALVKVIEMLPPPPFQAEPSQRRYAAGLEEGAPVYCFHVIPEPAYASSQNRRQIFRIGLWPDRPEEMLLSCTCGGDFSMPCEHLYLAAQRLLESIARPQHPGHRDIVRRLSKPYWYVTLRALAESSAFSQGASDAPVEKSERVVWRVGRAGETLALEPFVQTVKNGGSWSRGRRIRTQQLVEQHGELMSSWDAPILEAADGGALNWLRATAAHPWVFDAEPPHGAVRVTETPLLPSMTAEGEGIRLGFRFGGVHRTAAEIGRGWFEKEGTVALSDPVAGRLFFAQIEPVHRALLDILTNCPSRVPAARLSELIDVFVRVPDAVSVYVDPRLRKATAEPNMRPVLRLEPTGEAGLIAEVGFHPFGDAFWSVPGVGPDYLLRGVHGVPTGMQRNMSAERAVASQLADGIRSADVTPLGNFRYLTATVDDTASLLDAAKRLEIPHDVEWAKGTTPWTVSDMTSLNLRVQIAGKRGALFRIGIDAVMDDVELSHRMLMEALRTGNRYIALGPGRFARIEAHLRAALEAVDGADSGENKGGAEVSAAGALSLRQHLDGFESVLSADDNWRDLISRLQAAQQMEPAVPEGFVGALRGYQLAGYTWLCRLKASGFGVCLADDMGLGKTVQALALLLGTRSARPSLVVAPTSVASNWVRETERFAPTLRPLLHHGPDRSTELRDLGGDDLVITTYEILVRDKAMLTEIKFETVVIDEAQMAKNALTRRAKALSALNAETKIALTGTPVENRLSELWSIFHIVAPGLLGSARQFQKKFIVPIQRDGKRERMETLSRLIRPFVLRRLKAEVAPELPPRTETVRLVELYAEERKQYEAARRVALGELTSEKAETLTAQKRIHVLSRLTRLRRIVCHPRLADPSSSAESAKMDTAEGLLRDLLREDARALVFSQFTGHLALLRERLDDAALPYFYLDGSTAATVRGQLAERWLGGEGSLFLISLKAGGTGLNLTGADYVVHLDPWWNPAVEDQATDRTHRIGQVKPITVVRLIAADTVEEAVWDLHEKKRDLAERVLAGTDRAEETSTAFLVDLLSTRER